MQSLHLKRKKIILIAILVLVIVLVTLIFIQKWEKTKQLSFLKKEFQRCQNLENLTGDINWSLERKSSFHCLSSHYVYFCNLAPNPEEKKQCRITFLYVQALKESNIDYCQKAGEKASFCQALFKRDEILCEEGEFSQEEKILCKAIAKEDEKECENLPEAEIQKCKDNFYHLLALLKKGMVLCDKISYKRGAQVLCRGMLDVDECLKYRSEVECPEIYLPQIAELTKDPSWCERIPYKGDDDRGMFLYQTCLKNAK